MGNRSGQKEEGQITHVEPIAPANFAQTPCAFARFNSFSSSLSMAATLHWLRLILPALGLLICFDIIVSQYVGVSPACFLGASCNNLYSHEKTKALPISPPFLGLAGYSLLVALGFASRDRFVRFAYYASMIGTAFSLYLLTIASFSIQVKCSTCLISSALMTLLFLTYTVIIYFDAPNMIRINPIVRLGPISLALVSVLLYRLNTDPFEAPHDSNALQAASLAALMPVDRPILRSNDAHITVVLFSSFSCGACRSELPKLIGLVQSNRSLRLVYRSLPISDYVEAEVAGALLPSNDEFWAFARKLSDSAGAPGREDILSVVKSLGYDPNVFMARLRAPGRALQVVEEDAALARMLRLRGTPTAVVIGPGTIRRVVGAGVLSQLLSRRPYTNLVDHRSINLP
ncbi:MAG: thioredoxin domain-containing protein [Armatimonadetes bacterium]|nr:hypothetical protein [Armatimonadota bacterium]NOG38285.1 thioredoxin domain-containing protein [Armatimonadota bacterium]GIK32713.1 MAG: hypothetical protein BroJett009_17050 [Armatimonadota bacterium]